MTSVNAMRINNDTGILLCDEASYWNEEWMILYTPDKIQGVVGYDLIEQYRLALFIGMSGSSMMGERVMDGLTNRITKLYEQAVSRLGHPPKQFVTLEKLAWEAYNVASEVKAEYIDDFLISHFGFKTADLVAGHYKKDGKTIAIDDEDIQNEALKFVTFKGQPAEVGYIYKNTLFIAGYSPADGFKMYFLSTTTPVCEEVSEIYVTGGSGTDTTDLVYSDFAAQNQLRERREGLDLIDATIAAFSGLGTAFRLTAGVAPYPNFIYIDGQSEQLVQKTFDHRSQFISEVVIAGNNDLIPRATVRELVDKVLFKDLSFHEANQIFMARARNKRDLELFLRGYYLDRPTPPHTAPMLSSLK
ncbi:hypothetical protein ACFL27_18335 [candidate division CSSED10-310 bacterium]|uniref:Uncharacterized protein n=1 Tax=candidate division CSSED10-310 bacterium TaxID=2855610 RepID=A0ABV6Z120_UNCC1